MRFSTETLSTSQLDDITIKRILEIMRSSFGGNFEEEIMKQINYIRTRIIFVKTDGIINGFHLFSDLDSRIYPDSVKGIFAGDLAVDSDDPGMINFLISSVIKEIFKSYIDPINVQWFWFYPIASYNLFKYLFNSHKKFYPNPDGIFPEYEKSILDDFASQCFKEHYNPETMLISYPQSYWVKAEAEIITERDRRDQRFKLFNRMNPNPRDGKDLACITELNRNNLTRLSTKLLTGNQE
jgi:hypothetical protein